MLAEHNEICYELEGNGENVVHIAPYDMFMLRIRDSQFPRFSALRLRLSATDRISL